MGFRDKLGISEKRTVAITVFILALANTILIFSNLARLNKDMMLVLIVAAASTLAPAVIYYIWGRDPDDKIPEYATDAPSQKLEAWQIDILTNGYSKLTKEGLGALLMSIHMKGIATVQVEKEFLFKKVILVVEKKPKQEPTEIERDLISILSQEKVEENDKVIVYSYDPIKMSHHMKNFLQSGSDIRKHTYKATHSQEENAFERAFEEYYNTFGSWVLFGASITLILGCIVNIMIFMGSNPDATIISSPPLSIVCLTNAVLLMIAFIIIPKSVFSKFRDDYHEEYLKWLALKRTLNDYQKTQECLKQDTKRWRTWIIYATALGCADNLLKAMEELDDIDQKEYEWIRTAHRMSTMVANATISITSSSPEGQEPSDKSQLADQLI